MTPHLPPSVGRLAAMLFGPEALSSGPFSLLGVPVAMLSPDLVRAALERRLAYLRGHPVAGSFEAAMLDEALRVSAEKLSAPAIAAHLVARWTPPPAPSAPAETPIDLDESERRLEADARVLLALGSGWNAVVFRRLAWMAHARGIPSDRLAEVIRRVAESPAGVGPTAPRLEASPAPTQSDRVPLPTQLDPWSRHRSATIAIVATAMISLAISALSIALIVRTLSDRAAPSIPADAIDEVKAVGEVPEEPAATVQQSLPAPVGAAAERVSPLVLLREAVERARVNPSEGMRAAQAAVPELAEASLGFSVPEQRVVQSSLVDLVFSNAPESATQNLVESIAGALVDGLATPEPEAIAPAVWSAGMLTRLARERNLPAGLARSINQTLRQTLGPHAPGDGAEAEVGSRAALAAFVERLPPIAPGAGDATTSWDAWLSAARSVSPDDEARTGVVVLALARVCEAAPEPTGHAPTLAVIRRLADAADWSTPRARGWLIGAFDDPRISSPDLYAVTAALARQASVTGVDSALVVSATAPDVQRAELRDRYRTLWSLSAGYDREELVLELSREGRAALDEWTSAQTPEEQLRAAVRLARCSLSAHWLALGRDEAAVSAMERARAMSGPPSVRGLSRTPLAVPGDGSWALRLLGAGRHIQNRSDLLREWIDNPGSRLGPIDAEVLMSEALRGSPREVRELAAQAAELHADDPAVLAAALELLPTAPATLATSRLLEGLAGGPVPTPEHTEWRGIARTRLVERLLELLASTGEWTNIDLLAEDFARAYEQLAADVPPPSESLVAEPSPAESSASVIRAKWLEMARRLLPTDRPPVALDEVAAQRAARLQLASGPVQRFVVEQSAATRYLAVIVATERPQQAERVREVLEEADARRRGSTHILDQVAAGEAAMLRLWLLRLGEVQP